MKQTNLVAELKNYIKEKLQDYKGCEYHGSDMAGYLTESENVNGSVYCNTYLTVELIKENFDLFGEFLEYYQDNFGTMLNPFLEPEKTHVCFLICAVENILSGCELISDNWDEKIELNEENINNIIQYIETITEINF